MIFGIIKKEIDKWDPIELLACTSPDEYDIESEKIASKFQNDAEQDGMMIYEVFTEAFGTGFTESLDECTAIAKRIQELIRKAGI